MTKQEIIQEFTDITLDIKNSKEPPCHFLCYSDEEDNIVLSAAVNDDFISRMAVAVLNDKKNCDDLIVPTFSKMLGFISVHNSLCMKWMVANIMTALQFADTNGKDFTDTDKEVIVTLAEQIIDKFK